MRQLQTGDSAPDLSAVSDNGTPVDLAAWRGQWVVLFFFPRASTTHCQMQARRFESLIPEFERLGARVVGVSSDSLPQQIRFRDVCRLSFPLVADNIGAVCERFGVLEDDVVEGEESRRAKRETFLVDPAGRVARHWSNVDPDKHAGEVLADLRSRLGAT